MTNVLPIRVLCVDDHEIVREGVALKINRQPDMTVVAAAATGEQAIELFREHRPDITLMDLQLPSLSGLDAIHAIRKIEPGARIIVLTMYDGDENIYRAMHGGAVTYLLKGTLSDDLVRIVREVHAGGQPIPPGVATSLANRLSQSGLSPREVEVIELMAGGLRNKEIAARLGITTETARVHVKHILTKLRVKDRVAAVVVALERGIIHLK